MRLSIIIAVLDSHDVVRKQLEHFNKILPGKSVELILLDDGSDPPIRCHIGPDFKLRILQTNDDRPWSQPCARNFGASHAKGDYLYMTDIDHILTEESVMEALEFTDDKMVFDRKFAILDDNASICREHNILLEYGCPDHRLEAKSSHANTFVMKRQIFEQLGGYDSSFCGKYGGDDTDFNRRYGKLHYSGGCNRSVKAKSLIYVYPDPRRDIKRIFHKLRYK